MICWDLMGISGGFLVVSGGFGGSGRFSVEFWVVSWMSGGLLVGFWWILRFWAVFRGVDKFLGSKILLSKPY